MRTRIFVAVAMLLVAGYAMAATPVVAVAPPPLHIPFGTLITQFFAAWLPTITVFVLAAYGWLLRKLPATVVTWLKAAHTDTLLTRALNSAVAYVEGAEKGKVLSIPIANAVMYQAAQFVLKEAPWLFEELSGRFGPVLSGYLADWGMLPAATKGLERYPEIVPSAALATAPKAVAL